MDNLYKYPIKVVSQMTGLSVFVIRAWEKRYDAVVPTRTDTNRRLYSEEDIEKLKLLNEAVHQGHNISGIAHLTISELKKIIINRSPQTVKEEVFTNESYEKSEIILNNCIEAIKTYDGKLLETILLKASSKISQPLLIENIIVPLVYKMGELWHDGLIRVANEHLASNVIRSFISNLIEKHKPSQNAPIFVSATPRGQDHELGAMIASVVAASAGWKIIYLGPNLPVEEIASVADYLAAKVIALSVVYPNDDPQLKKDFINLKKMIPANVTLIVGGRAASGYLDVLDEINAIIVKDTNHLKMELEAIRENRYN